MAQFTYVPYNIFQVLWKFIEHFRKSALFLLKKKKIKKKRETNALHYTGRGTFITTQMLFIVPGPT